jgi:hypothetical protein
VVVKELFAKLGLDLDEGQFEEGNRAIDSLRVGLVGLTGFAIGAASALAAMVKATADDAGRINDMAKSAGVSTTALQELQHAAKLSGVDLDELHQSLVFLSRSAVGAAAGSAEASAAYAKLGIQVRGADGKIRPAEHLLGEIADKFQGMPDGVQKTALAMQLFGRGGTRMISFLDEGGTAIAAFRQEAEQLGFVLDEKTVAAGDDLGDNLDRLHDLMIGLRNTIAGPFLASAVRLTKAILDWAKANREVIKAQLTSYVNAFVTALKVLAATLIVVGSLIAAYVAGMVAMQLAMLATIAGGIVPMIGALGGMLVALIANAAPIVALGALVLVFAAILGLVAEDIYQFATGGQSLLGDMVYLIGELFSYLGDLLTDVWHGILGGLYSFGHTLQDFFGGIADWISKKVQSMVDVIKAPLEALSSLVQKMSGGINSAVEFAFGPNKVGGGATPALAGVPSMLDAMSFGGGSSPAASAQLASGAAPRSLVLAPQTSVTVNATTGASAEDIAGTVRAHVDDALDTHYRQAAAAVGG